MDRKGWIVVIFCCIGIALNAYYGSQRQPLPPAKPAIAAPGSQAQPAGASEKISAAPDASKAQAAAATSRKPAQEHRLVSSQVTWHFSSQGGGIAKVELGGRDQITLNQHGQEAIGALRREATGRDELDYSIASKDDQHISYQSTTPDGIEVRKTWKLDPKDSHLVTLQLELTNRSDKSHRSEEWHLYSGAANSMSPAEALKPSYFLNDAGDTQQHTTDNFAGGMFSQEKAEMRSSHTRLRYSGVMSRFYTQILSHEARTDAPGKVWAARVRINHANDQFKNTSGADNDYAIESAMSLPPVELAAGKSQSLSYSLYAGPKEYGRLAALGGQRDSVRFYGMWGFISRPLNSLMRWMHDLSGNWGLAIILMTLIIRTILWPLQAKAQFSMKRMGKLAPLMKDLQERHKDDPTRQQVEVMKLYKEYGVNPLGGCLPMLLQIPIFFAFYGVLQNAAELRGQGWLWVKDLSVADTVGQFLGFDVNPLPLIMGVTMIAQMKFTPQPASMDKAQKFMMNLMPFFFLWICYSFASALALYWSVTNLYAIAQTWIMKLYMPEPELVKVAHMPKGPAPRNPFFNPANPTHKERKEKPRQPKLGG